jgi:hypothetical protein
MSFLQQHINRAKNQGVYPNGLHKRINDIIDFELDTIRSKTRTDCEYYYVNMKGVSEKDTQNIREYCPDLPKQFNLIIEANMFRISPILSIKFEPEIVQNAKEEVYVNY